MICISEEVRNEGVKWFYRREKQPNVTHHSEKWVKLRDLVENGREKNVILAIKVQNKGISMQSKALDQHKYFSFVYHFIHRFLLLSFPFIPKPSAYFPSTILSLLPQTLCSFPWLFHILALKKHKIMQQSTPEGSERVSNEQKKMGKKSHPGHRFEQ